MNDFNQQLALVGAATSYSDVYQLPADVGHVEASAVVSAIAGTTPTLIVTIQTSQDKVTWEDRNVLPTFAATGTKKVRASEPRIYFRFKLVLAGTTPTATVTLFAIGREGEGDASEMLTMQDAAVATGNGTSLDVSGMATAVIGITGTFVGTVTFEGSLDDSTWVSLLATKVGDGTISSTTSGTGVFRLAVAGLKSVRARVSAYTSGSITAIGRAVATSSATEDSNYVDLRTAIKGEDQSRNIMNVEETADGHNRITSATTTVVLTGAGALLGLFIEAALTGTVTVYDNTSAAGTNPLILPAATAAGYHRFPRKFTTGITIVTSAADRVVALYKNT